MGTILEPKRFVQAPVDADGGLQGFIHSYETGGAVDGPGMRFVLFVQGCQMRCRYCHNPDSWKLRGGALKSVDEVVAEIGKYASFLRAAGGVTISGGEPLMQAPFVGAIARMVKERYGLHIAIDTNGALVSHVAEAWWQPVDLVLLDIKHIDPGAHNALTATPLQPVLDGARRLADMGKPLWIRYVLVPGWTDRVRDVERMADFVASLGTIERVEVLPFHQHGSAKWQELGANYTLAATDPPSPELVERVVALFKSRGLTAIA